MKNKKLILGAAALPAFAIGMSAQTAKLPNIVIAISDDQSFPYASAYGTEWVNTPGFDYVAEHGILFNNCFTPNSKSAPSRAATLTGRYSWQLEEAGNHTGRWPLGKYPTIMEALLENGYATGYTGKGWSPGDPQYYKGAPRLVTGKPYQDKKVNPLTSKISSIDYASNFEDFMESRPKDRPFMFWYGAHEPHRPYELGSGTELGKKDTKSIKHVPGYWPDNEIVRSDMLDYALEIEYFDSHLQRIIKTLEEAGELENTIIFVTADNGMPFPRRKGNGYEVSCHLPLAVMWPAGIKNPGRQSDEYVSLIDIVPTVLEVAQKTDEGIGMEKVSGKSMVDIFKDKTKHRDYILFGQERHDYGRPMNQGYPIRSILWNGYMYSFNFKPELWPACDPETGYLNCDGSPTKTFILNMKRNGEDTYYWDLCFGKHPQEELFYIPDDPDCLNNIADDPKYAGVVKKLRKILFKELEHTADPRVCADGGVFDRYPFMLPTSELYYERYMSGKITKYQTGWCNESDYEVNNFKHD